MFNFGKEAIDRLMLPENIAKNKAAVVEVVNEILRTNTVHIDVSKDDSGLHFVLNTTPKGNPQ